MSYNRQTQKIESKNLDHLGLVAGMYDELGIGDIIDEAIEQDKEKRLVSIGQAVKAMVLNGLGFVNQRLYLFPKFFQDKPIDRLIGEGICASQLNEHVMGRTLDDIYDYDATSLYSQIAVGATQALNLECRSSHLDSTSFHTDGTYKTKEGCEEINTSKLTTEEDVPDRKQGSDADSSKIINITKGYSRDHRPDLNQAILQLIVENQAGIPLLMKSMDGNNDDKTGFRETIQAHISQLTEAYPLKYIVADSALYTASSLQVLSLNPGIHWISRVPETITEAKEAIEKVELSEMTVIDEQTRYQAITSNYADIEQRWIIVHSSQAEKRAKRTLDKQCFKASTANLKAFNTLCNKTFDQKKEARKALQEFEKKLLFTGIVESKIKAIPRYKKRGKPHKDTKPDHYVYQIEGCLASLLTPRETRLKRKSCFIIATDELDEKALPDTEVIVQYKNQQKVERGFRFLKDPMFLADSLFLKSPKRIMALMMVMTICLLVYAALEYRIRQSLKEKKQTFPNQKGKFTENPTIRWIFQYFVGIHLVVIQQAQKPVQVIVSNLDEHHRNVLSLLGRRYEAFYY
jgi:transposase